jgi:TrmH family RNA methyltransferase
MTGCSQNPAIPEAATHSALDFDKLSVVLVNPLYPGNIGSTARAMKTMGLSHLVLVAPRVLPDEETYRMAVEASDIVDGIMYCDTIEEACSSFGLCIGVTRRMGKRRHRVLTPEELAREILPRYIPARVALLFGSESSGLSNEDVEHCNYLVSIPSSARYGTLNLSHAVMIMCYEIFKAHGAFEHPGAKEDFVWSSPAQMATFYKVLRGTLDEIDFSSPDRRDHVVADIKGVLSRTRLEEWEMKLFLGVMRQVRNRFRLVDLQKLSDVEYSRDSSAGTA